MEKDKDDLGNGSKVHSGTATAESLVSQEQGLVAPPQKIWLRASRESRFGIGVVVSPVLEGSYNIEYVRADIASAEYVRGYEKCREDAAKVSSRHCGNHSHQYGSKCSAEIESEIRALIPNPISQVTASRCGAFSNRTRIAP
jgi:hypothetical protein